jgi:thioredoxin reductase
MKSLKRVAVIGAGPGGIAAAVQLKRFGLEPLLFEKHEAGGLLRNANWVENYPGFPNGVSGIDLAAKMKTHLEVLDIPVLNREVVQLDYDEGTGSFTLVAGDKGYSADFVVMASGTRPCRLRQTEGLPGYMGRKIFYEVLPIGGCENKHIVIVGAGDAAFDYALNLVETPSNRITIIYRGSEIKALPLLHARSLEKDNITLLEQSEIVSIGQGAADTLQLEVQQPAGRSRVDCDYVLAAVGREAEKGYFTPWLQDIEEELVMRELLLPVGDVKNGLLRQASIAVGNGVEAAMRVYRAIKE